MSSASRSRAELAAALRPLLLEPEAAAALDVHGRDDAAVLVPLFAVRRRASHVVLTQRRDDLRRHAGEISFPGGRQDGDEEDLRDDRAARGARGDRPAAGRRRADRRAAADADDRDELRRLSVRRADRARPRVERRRAREVEEVLELPLAELRAGYGRRRLMRRGVPFRTDTYEVGEHLVWGATARILADLFERADARRPALTRPPSLAGRR